MRLKARIDANHTEIVKALRGIGASVQSLAQLGGGVPDLLVGRRGKNLLLEVKDGTKPPRERWLTLDEARFVLEWQGGTRVVFSAEEAVKYVLENT